MKGNAFQSIWLWVTRVRGFLNFFFLIIVIIVLIISSAFTIILFIDIVDEPRENKVVLEVTAWSVAPLDSEPTNVIIRAAVDIDRDGSFDKEFASHVYSNVSSVSEPLIAIFLVEKNLNGFDFMVIVEEIREDGVYDMRYLPSEIVPIHTALNKVGANDTWVYSPPVDEGSPTIGESRYCTILFFYYILPVSEHDPDLPLLGQPGGSQLPRDAIAQGLFIASIMLIVMAVTRTVRALVIHMGVDDLESHPVFRLDEKQLFLKKAKRLEAKVADTFGSFIEAGVAFFIMVFSYKAWGFDVVVYFVLMLVATLLIGLQLAQLLWFKSKAKRLRQEFQSTILRTDVDEYR